MTDTHHSVADPVALLRIQTKIKKVAHAAKTWPDLANSLTQVCLAFPHLDCVWIWSREASSDRLVLESSAGVDPQVQRILSNMEYSEAVVSNLLVGHEVVIGWDDLWGEKSKVFRETGLNQVGVLPLELTDGRLVAMGFASRQSSEFDSILLNAMRLAIMDLGQRHQMLHLETQLSGARQNFGQIISALDGFLFVVNQKGQILHSNLSELGSGSALTNIDSILPDGARLIRQQREQLPSISVQDNKIPNQCRLRRENGHPLPVDVQVRPIQWNGLQAYLLSCRDITQQLVIEKERNRLVTAIEQTADGIVITDSAGIIQYTNPAFTRMTGYTSAEVLGENPRILKSNRHDAAYYREMWSTIRRGETWQGRLANRMKSGQEYWEVATISPVLDTSGVITHFVCVKRDITSELKLEERLRQSQKLEAIGTLAGGIAHDFNNILYALLGNSQLALDDIPNDHPAYLPMTEIVKAGERGSALVAKMLAFGQRAEKQREIQPLQPIILEVMELVRASLPTTIRIEMDLDETCQSALLDEAQIHQTVLNLCTNAGHAMGHAGGVLTLGLHQTTVLEDTPEALSGMALGEYLEMTVSDTGVGMDQAVLSRIFEPYFTTKKSDEGTGLGLASVHGIVSNHDGRIQVTSTPGKGSTFTLSFPVAVGHAPQDEAKVLPDEMVQGHGRVMIVDDEPMITDLVMRGLKRLGFEVTGFTDGIEALEVFRKNPNAFDVVVTDQTMPNITGYELATQLSSLRPDLPIVLSTGYSEAVSEQDLKQAGISCFLPKPLRIKELAAVLCDITEPVGSLRGD